MSSSAALNVLRETLAYLVFGGYFVVIAFARWFVFRSLVKDTKHADLFEGTPYLLLRCALGALLCTWYFMIKYMAWSHEAYTNLHRNASVGQWLLNTGLFEEAWSTVCAGASGWWWSSFICTWTVVFTAVIWRESSRRDIAYPWAYMLFGMLVAMSVSNALFFTAVVTHPAQSTQKPEAPLRLLLPLGLAMLAVHLTPSFVGTERFLPNLLWLHVLLILPLILPLAPTKNVIKTSATVNISQTMPFWSVHLALAVAAIYIHGTNTMRVWEEVPAGVTTTEHLWQHVFSHPAQTSISMDVMWVAATLAATWISAGSAVAVIAKILFTATLFVSIMAPWTGVNWALVASLVPMGLLLVIGVAGMGLNRIRNRNVEKRKAMLDKLGIVENGVIPGTSKKPPSKAGPRVVVGFWHPYCNAGGGGERVLWSAIKFLQKSQPDVVCLVYSGDYPAASKEAILAKVQGRFSIDLSPATIHFVPLPSRHLIGDAYWKQFTLLGQSFGSLVLAWEGLTGKDGLWGDIFIDTMGYAFTFPFVRFVTGGQVAIGTYTHYPTVSTDMVKRVKNREEGVENAGAASSWLKTRIKLAYYSIFTSLYSLSLLFSEHTMTNSSWTQAHIQSLILAGRKSLIADVFMLNAETTASPNGAKPVKVACEVVYPPCDTDRLAGLGTKGRGGEIISLAQFRPEKGHAKQVSAMARLYEAHPEYRTGPSRVTLTMMGGARDAGDENRVEGLKALAKELGIEENVEFVVNAPYPEIVQRLGKASIGLNTMQDEHFGINIVEFMAAGLIPVVHASAGPLLDIVTPYKRQRTGFLAKTVDEFADALHEALTLSASEERKVREAARKAAVERFSLKEFERGFARGFGVLRGLAEGRRQTEE